MVARRDTMMGVLVLNMELPKQFDNITQRVIDDLKATLQKGSKVSVAAASFSIYAFEALQKELEKIDELRFIFTSPTFNKERSKKQKRELKDLRSEWKYNRLVSWYSSNWPLIALLLIPIFALLLMLFFRKEKLGYMSHLVFALHLHSVLLIISAVMLILLWQGCHLGAIYGLLWIYFLVYSIIAVRRVYSRSSWGKAILKTFLLYGSYWIVWFTVFILSLVWISKNVLE